MKNLVLPAFVFILVIIFSPASSQQRFDLIYPLQHNTEGQVKIHALGGGNRFLTYIDEEPILYDLSYGISVKKLAKHSGSVSKVLSTGKLFYTLGGSDIFTFDENGNRHGHFAYGEGRGIRDMDVAGNYVAGGGFQDVFIWNRQTGNIVSLAHIGYDSWSEQVAFINNGNQVLTLGTYYTGSSLLNSNGDWKNHHNDSLLYIWDTKTGSALAKIPVPGGRIDYFRYDKASNQLLVCSGEGIYRCSLPVTFAKAGKKENAPVVAVKPLLEIPGTLIVDFEVDWRYNNLLVYAYEKAVLTEKILFLDLDGKQKREEYIWDEVTSPLIKLHHNNVWLERYSETTFIDLGTGKQTTLMVKNVVPVGKDAYLCLAGATREDIRFNPSIQLRMFATGDVVKEMQPQLNVLTTAYTNRFGQLGLLASKQCDLIDINANSKLRYEPVEYGSFDNTRFVRLDTLLAGSRAKGGLIFVTNTTTGETTPVENITGSYYTAITGATNRNFVGIIKDTVKLFDPLTFEVKRSFPQESLNHFEGKTSQRLADPFELIKKVMAVAVVSGDEQLLACSETDSTVVIKDGENRFLRRVQIPVGKNEYSHMMFLRGTHTLLCFITGGAVFSIDADKGSFKEIGMVDDIFDDVVEVIELNDERTLLVTTDLGAACFIDKHTGDSLWSIGWKEKWVNAELSDDQHFLFGWDESNVVTIYDVAKKQKLKTIRTGLGSLIDGVVDTANNRFMAISKDLTVHLYDLSTTQKEITIVDQPADGMVTVTKDNYYASTKGSVKQLLFKNGDRLIAPEQLDIKFNRPDIVLEKLKNKNTALIGSLRQAYAKRLKKLGLDSASLRITGNLPEAVMPVQLPQLVKQKKYALKLSFTDAGYALSHMNAWVNGVPVYGLKGLRITGNRKRFDTTIQLTLTEGTNVIEYSATNVVGGESYRSPLTVKYDPVEPVVSKTYFIGIGVDRYKDASRNLSWSVKDVHDLATKLKEHYPALLVDTLFNSSVTVQNVLALRNRLTSLSEDDKVIVAFSGHGLLDKKGDYYLGTWDVNFDSPEQEGLAYEQVEGLFDSIAPRYKLLLLDACHSGELDKDEISRIEAAKEKLDSLGTNVRSTIKVTSSKRVGMYNSFELMQNLFMNVSRGTGTVVISAAGGMQYAQERGDLKNGVFTYSIIDAFNKHEHLTVTQLKQIVSDSVVKLTDGLQKPTSRSETKFDWIVW